MKKITRKLSTIVIIAVSVLYCEASAQVTYYIHHPPPVFVPPNPDTWGLKSTRGANTSGSFAAAAIMGEKGWNGCDAPPNWETLLVGDPNASPPTIGTCTTQTGSSKWPSSCNPAGMVSALSRPPFTSTTCTANWVTSVLQGVLPTPTDPTPNDPNKLPAGTNVVNSIRLHGSPAIIPMYGQADHWLAVTEITATQSGTNYVVNNLKYYDGGPAGQTDSSAEDYMSAGVHVMQAFSFSGGYYSVLVAINPNPVDNAADFYYGKWVLLFEPPAGQDISSLNDSTPMTFARAPAISPNMSELLAQANAWKSLSAAKVDTDPLVSRIMSIGVPGTAFLVEGVWPSGAPWNYYLVPILSSENVNSVIALVQLSADDGSFEDIQILGKPAPFSPVTLVKAESLARAAISADEDLLPGVLTWDPRKPITINKSPTSPYYEFGVVNIKNSDKVLGTVRVKLNGGLVIRGE